MSVFGILPRDFYEEDATGIMALAGALQTDLTVYEKALRIRQTSLAAVQHAIIEDRVARANRTRPHQLPLDQLVAGTSEVEFYREVQNDVGWRGPALLLRLDSEKGTAVIQYQGRPYLVALRHVRLYKGIYLVEIPNAETEDSLGRAMKHVEDMVPYKTNVIGWICKKNGTWITLPVDMQKVCEL